MNQPASDEDRHRQLSTTLEMLGGLAANRNLTKAEIGAFIQQFQVYANCGFPDVERRAEQIIDQLVDRLVAKPWWQFWK